MIDKIRPYLGLALKARRIHVGEDLNKNLERNKIHLLLIASDHNSQTQTKLMNKANEKKITVNKQFTTKQLANALNYEVISAVGISDVHLAKHIKKILKEEKI